MAETLSLDPATVGRHALIHETSSTAQTEVIPVVPRQPEAALGVPDASRTRQHVRRTMYFPVASLAVLGVMAASLGETPPVDTYRKPHPPVQEEAPPPYVANVPGMSFETSASTPHNPAPTTGAEIAKLHTE